MRTLVILIALSLITSVQAAQIRIHGTVTDNNSRDPLGQVLVRVYKDGVKQQISYTNQGGRYSAVLDNDAYYVVRFSIAGRVTKCFAIDTRGKAWEGDNRIVDLEVEMTLFQTVSGLDLSFFDMPMGIARFTPMTGYLSWNKAYEERVKPEVDRLMAEVAVVRERQATAQR